MGHGWAMSIMSCSDHLRPKIYGILSFGVEISLVSRGAGRSLEFSLWVFALTDGGLMREASHPWNVGKMLRPPQRKDHIMVSFMGNSRSFWMLEGRLPHFVYWVCGGIFPMKTGVFYHLTWRYHGDRMGIKPMMIWWISKICSFSTILRDDWLRWRAYFWDRFKVGKTIYC